MGIEQNLGRNLKIGLTVAAVGLGIAACAEMPEFLDINEFHPLYSDYFIPKNNDPNLVCNFDPDKFKYLSIEETNFFQKNDDKESYAQLYMNKSGESLTRYVYKPTGTVFFEGYDLDGKPPFDCARADVDGNGLRKVDPNFLPNTFTLKAPPPRTI